MGDAHDQVQGVRAGVNNPRHGLDHEFQPLAAIDESEGANDFPSVSEAADVAAASAVAAEPVFAVTPPPFRRDLERPVDLVEEVARIHGLEHLPETLPLRGEAVGLLTTDQQVRRRIAGTLIGAGLDEVVTYSFVAADAAARWAWPPTTVAARPSRWPTP